MLNRQSISFFAAALLTAAAAAAQDLEATVVRNPNDTVTYTIDLDGPPRGTGYVFAGYGLLPSAVPLPFGPLHLDPLLSLRLGVVPLDPYGKGQMQLTVPARLVNGDMIHFQALMNDRGILRLTPSFRSCLYHVGSNFNGSLQTILMHNPRTQVYRGEFRGKPGSSVEIVHYRGGQIDIWRGIIPRSGILPVQFNYKHAQKHKDQIEIRLDGKSVKTWRR